jgi:hypothetical protein
MENYNSHTRFCIFRQETGEYEPFWELLKMNLLQKLEVNLMKYRIRTNTLRIEEGAGKVSFTNNQNEIEIYLNKVIKGKETRLGELRIRKDDDQLLKESIKRKIITLNEEEIKINAGKSCEEKINIRKTQ